jgi:hypothetical protein
MLRRDPGPARSRCSGVSKPDALPVSVALLCCESLKRSDMSSMSSAWSGDLFEFEPDQSNTDEPGFGNTFDMTRADAQTTDDLVFGSESLELACYGLALDWQPSQMLTHQYTLPVDSLGLEGSSTVHNYAFTSGTTSTATRHQQTGSTPSTEEAHSAETSPAGMVPCEPITEIAGQTASLSTLRPQCWQHGCRGRTFTSFSNYRRHVKEKEGKIKKVTCPRCGQQFARASGRNIHYAQRRCKITLFDANGVPVKVRMGLE